MILGFLISHTLTARHCNYAKAFRTRCPNKYRADEALVHFASLHFTSLHFSHTQLFFCGGNPSCSQANRLFFIFHFKQLAKIKTQRKSVFSESYFPSRFTCKFASAVNAGEYLSHFLVSPEKKKLMKCVNETRRLEADDNDDDDDDLIVFDHL